jgi:hypothetical protein
VTGARVEGRRPRRRDFGVGCTEVLYTEANGRARAKRERNGQTGFGMTGVKKVLPRTCSCFLPLLLLQYTVIIIIQHDNIIP